VQKEQELDYVLRFSSKMVHDIMPHILDKFFVNYVCTVFNGFVRSVAADGLFWNVYAFFLYFAAIALMIYIWSKDHQSKAAKLMLLALIMVGVNVCSVALMIMCLSRYMIYSTSLFYIAVILLIQELIYIKKRGKNSGI